MQRYWVQRLWLEFEQFEYVFLERTGFGQLLEVRDRFSFTDAAGVFASCCEIAQQRT